MNVGPLRVFNEYTIECSKVNWDFNWQSQRDIEIVTFVIEGGYIYKDNQGTNETISSGDVCVTSAGTGIISATQSVPEVNRVKLIEAWLFPSKYSVKPTWRKRNHTVESYTNKFLPIVASENGLENGSALKINQDANFYISNLIPNNQLEYRLLEGRTLYLFNESGIVFLNKESNICAGDSARIFSEGSDDIAIRNEGSDPALLMLVELPKEI